VAIQIDPSQPELISPEQFKSRRTNCIERSQVQAWRCGVAGLFLRAPETKTVAALLLCRITQLQWAPETAKGGIGHHTWATTLPGKLPELTVATG